MCPSCSLSQRAVINSDIAGEFAPAFTFIPTFIHTFTFLSPTFSHLRTPSLAPVSSTSPLYFGEWRAVIYHRRDSRNIRPERAGFWRFWRRKHGRKSTRGQRRQKRSKSARSPPPKRRRNGKLLRPGNRGRVQLSLTGSRPARAIIAGDFSGFTVRSCRRTENQCGAAACGSDWRGVGEIAGCRNATSEVTSTATLQQLGSPEMPRHL